MTSKQKRLAKDHAKTIVTIKTMSDEIILKYDRQIPRYTSYPTAPHFRSDINSEIYSSWLTELPNEETLSLYFHIPFCKQLCWYCGCYTKATRRYAPIEDYIHILIREIKIISSLLGQKKRHVTHIHFGGGSPTILHKDTFHHLMMAIRTEFIITSDAEIAIEVDPRNLVGDDIKNYAKEGINRVSIGVQDFNHEVQLAINREQSFDLVYDCVKLFKKYGIDDINLDLIYGLPKQTLEMIERNIEYSLLLKPQRIALFSYAHVQWMKKHMRLIKEEDLPLAKTKIEMYRTAATKLIAKEYIPIGLDHFARKENLMTIAKENKNLKRNFQGYSTDNGTAIIGFGVSAISYLPNGYAQNTLDFSEYEKNILSEKLPVKKGVKTTKEDKIRKKIIDEIMCYLEVDLNKICKTYNLKNDYFTTEIKALEKLENDNLIKIQENKIIINSSFPQISRIVASFFDEYLEENNKKHSKIA